MACAYLYNHPSVRYNKNASVTSNCSPLVGVPFFFSRSFLMHSFTRLIEVMWCRCDWMKNVTALFSPCATCHWKAARIKALISSISPVLHRLSHIFSPIFQSFVFVCVWVRFFMLRFYSWWGRGTERYVIFDDGCDNRREKALLTRTWLSVNVLLSYVPCLCAVFLAVEICDRCLLDGFTRYDFRLFLQPWYCNSCQIYGITLSASVAFG